MVRESLRGISDTYLEVDVVETLDEVDALLDVDTLEEVDTLQFQSKQLRLPQTFISETNNGRPLFAFYLKF